MIAFGPVPSRRLGLSLGINNIVSRKVCSYSCVYCQIGETQSKSALRTVFYEPGKLIENVGNHLEKLDERHQPDYLTFVANGEPTLDINLGEEIRLLKRFGIPVAVITNSSLLHLPEVRDDLREADWVSVKVDTVNELAWRKINRPPVFLKLKEVLSGIRHFANEYDGKLHTETMLVQGFNDSEKQIRETAQFISGLNPASAYLSIPTRPPAVKNVKPVSEEILTAAWQIFSESGINTELLAGFEGTDTGFTGNAFDDILNICAVHPLRQDTMQELLKKDNTDMSVIESLVFQRLIKKVKYEGMDYYLRSYHF
ncbi:radical SAM protein [Gaoshiqia sediminis]|uniref:Radical SAM protein n=1 Tax=Gaoshiqia sediminis TaxID=2986998 RepID=A0AA41Y4E9_9BACT|nr:radical SAM protein [Gaoshiqia sediminis]MCW0483239.1 radical SAM protein [Gaoshiqia sediminis]